MEHQLDILKQKTLPQSATGKGSSQPTAISSPQNAGHQDQLWLQQANLDALDAFLNQAKGSGNNNPAMGKPGKTSKKWKLAQP